MTKALFFDIDGTLVSFKTHSVPSSTVEALKITKSKGIKVYISTGRPVQLINNIDSVKHLIDGYMTTNGACCFIGDKIVRVTPVSPEDVNVFMDASNKMGFSCILVGTNGISALNPDEKLKRVFKGMLDIDYEKMEQPLSETLKSPIIQITPFISVDTERKIFKSLNSCTTARWHPEFSDVTSRLADKGQGLEAMAKATGIEIEETMAFGDGGNDIPILRRAGIGVAMGNALDNVKAAADYVTSSIDDDGVSNALEHFGII